MADSAEPPTLDHAGAAGTNPRPDTAVPRRTRQRDEVRAALTEAGGFRTAQQLYADLQRAGSGIGLTTVYRVLQLLADVGEADVMRLPNGARLYRRCDASAHHHHHLVCRRCGHSVEIEGLGVDIRAETLAGEHGFTEVDHTVEIFGTCASCARRTPETEAPETETEALETEALETEALETEAL